MSKSLRKLENNSTSEQAVFDPVIFNKQIVSKNADITTTKEDDFFMSYLIQGFMSVGG